MEDRRPRGVGIGEADTQGGDSGTEGGCFPSGTLLVTGLVNGRQRGVYRCHTAVDAATTDRGG